jgi:hypothetical protein
VVARSDWQVQVLRVQETFLLVMHIVGEILKPGDSIWIRSESLSRRRRHVDQKGEANRPTLASIQIARVLNVPEETVDLHVDP